MSSTTTSSSNENELTEEKLSPSKLSFVDIGANLLDEMYQGNYRGKQRHEADLSTVLQRAFDNNVDRIIITCGTLEESRKGLELAQSDDRLFCTVGVHPTRCATELFDSSSSSSSSDESLNMTYIQNLKDVVTQGKEEGHVVAIGELGLDYARLEFSDKESQKRGLMAQLELAKEAKLPLFLHNRETGNDLLEMLQEHYVDDTTKNNNDGCDETKTTIPQIRPPGGVVHSFDDTIELANEFIKMGLYIGINGCSLKTSENLNVVKQIPLNKILLETDCPWCDIRASHAGFQHVQTKFQTKNEKKYEKGCCVKGRYEPMHIVQVAEVIAGIKGVSVEEVAKASKENALKLFGPLVKRKH